MASGTKKKNQKKGKTLNLQEFLADHNPGNTFVPKHSWADEVDDEDSTMPPGRPQQPIQLPTAPRAARGLNIDMSRIPSKPPYTAYVGNLPFDVEEQDIADFFRGLSIVNIRIPEGRHRKFGYVEFEDRESLLEGLALDDQKMRNNQIRVDPADGPQGGDRDRDRDRRGGFDRDEPDEDRTIGDWRKPRGDTGGDRFSDRDRGSFGDRDRGGFGDRDRGGFGDRDRDRGGFGDRDRDRGGFGDRDRGFGDRDRGFGSRDRGFDRDRGFGGDRDRDRGFGGDRDRDRGFGGDRDRGFGGDRDRGFGGDRDRDRGFGGDRDRDRGFGGDRDRDRGFGGDRDRDRGFGGFRDDRDGGRRSFGSGFRDDRGGDRGGGRYGSERYGGFRDDRSGYRDRYDRDRRDDDRAPSRDGPAPERPRLKLAPRTKPIETKTKEEQTTSSIFGGAKPVDTAAREREIEERLKRQREIEVEKLEQEKETRLSSSTSERNRHSSQEDSAPRRERKSSSSSGKGIRTVAPPPGAGSARVRTDSALSEPEDVFEEDKPASKASPKKEESEIIPAPPPKENPWLKRMEAKPAAESRERTSESSSHGDEPQLSPPPQKETTDAKDAQREPSSPPQKNAWSKGKPDLVPSEPPKENAWTKRATKAEPDKDKKDQDGFSGSHWGSNKKRDNGPQNNQDQSSGGRPPNKEKREKPIPKSIDEMPKYSEKSSRDWSDDNKFSTLMADDDNDVCNSDQ